MLRKYKIGDTVCIPEPARLEAGGNRDEALRSVLIAMASGALPEFAQEKIKYMTIRTQAQADQLNREGQNARR